MPLTLPQAEAEVRTFHAKAKVLRPALRDPTEAEATLIAEALAAGAVINPRLWGEYFGDLGGSLPFQWEGGWVHAEDMDQPWIVEAAEAFRVRKDAYFARLAVGGDLHPMVMDVLGERLAASVAVAA